jgi:hypothetical protein
MLLILVLGRQRQEESQVQGQPGLQGMETVSKQQGRKRERKRKREEGRSI